MYIHIHMPSDKEKLEHKFGDMRFAEHADTDALRPALPEGIVVLGRGDVLIHTYIYIYVT